LGDGTRLPKSSLRVAAYGTADELNSCIGVARLHSNGKLDDALSQIQNDLFDLGADLCCPHHDLDKEKEYPSLRIVDAQVERLEHEIDTITANLDPLKSFILPGGSTLSAYLHICRTVARRCERLVVELAETDTINPAAIKYLNRLSDWFFVTARFENNAGRNDILWVPGANR